jgi:hypothetical protein
MRPFLALVALALVLLVPRPALAAWANTGNTVVTNGVFTFGFPTPGGGFSSMCSDGHGGLYVAFHQNASSTPDSLKIQRLDRDGAVVWVGSRGLPVGPGEGLGNTPTLLADGSGGVWVAYFNSFSGSGFTNGLYAQHFDENGDTSIPFPGIRVGGVSTGMTGQPRAAVTTGGKLLAMWIGQGAVGATDTVRVQRVSQNGTLDFAAAGVVLGTSTQLGNDMFAQSIAADGSGLVAVWSEETNSTGPDRLRASRVSSAGAIQWGSQGNNVFEDPDFAVLFADAIWDATNGLTIAFSATDLANGGNDLFVMRLAPAGTLNASWGTVSSPEVVVSSGMDPSTQRSLRIVDDNANGCIVGWVDVRNTAVVGPGGVPFRRDIRAQRYNSTGTRMWTSGGVAVNTSENDQHQLTMIPDDSGGAYLAYETIPGNDLITDATGDVEVTHISSIGAVLWNTFHAGATQPVAPDGEQGEVMLAEDGGGGVMFAWDRPGGITANHRQSNASLYVPLFDVLGPNGGEFFGAMQPIPITWWSNVGGNVKIEYTLNNGAPVTISASTPDDGSQTWYAPIQNSAQVRVRISSVDMPIADDYSDNFFSICPTVNTPVTAGGPVTAPRDVVVGDFDEDGILDLAVTVSGGIAILPGNGAAGVGDATFSGATVYATPSAANRVAIGDFDEDGILDLAVTHGSGLMRFMGHGVGGVGDGTFGTGSAIVGIGGCVGIVAGDFDNDGVFDLAVTDTVNNQVGIFHGLSNTTGDGSGLFTLLDFYGTGSNPEAIAAADLDLDGDLDLVTANFIGNSITRLRNTGSNGFGTAVFTASSQTTFSGPRAIVLHDLDDDGDPDVAVGNAAGISVHINNLVAGISTLGNSSDYISGLPMADIVVADPSRNGIEDIVGASLIGALETFFGDGVSPVGDGTFTVGGGLVTTGTTPDAIAADDFNEDGRIDFVIANLATNNLTVFTGGCASTSNTAPVVSSPNGGEIFQPSTFRTITWTKGTTTTSVDVEVSRDAGVNWERIATDAPGTSLSWKVALPASNQARVRVLAHGHPQRSDLSNANFTICDALANAGATATTAAGGPKDAVVADFNEDGIPDLVHDVAVGIAFKRGLGTAGVGNGTFASDVSYPAGSDGRNLVAADFNEDGILDVATTRAGGVAVFAGGGTGGVGNGTFGAATLVPAGSDPTGIATGDFNEDGIQDLVVSSLGSDSIFVLLGGGANGVGDGTFPVRNRYFAGDAPGRITTGDFNEDGILDLAIASPSTTVPGTQIMLGSGAAGTGNGAFTATSRIAATNGTSDATLDVATGDFNEDGITDLAITSAFRVIVARGNGAGGVGNGTFAVPSPLEAQFGTQHVAVGDFNRDGRADLLVSYDGISPTGSVHLLYGMGAGTVGNATFEQSDDHSLALGLGPIVLSDFDEDGELDALVGAPFSNQYVRLLSGCGNSAASVTLSVPNGAQEWLAGTQQVISWSASPTVMSVDVEVSRDGGNNYETVARGLTANSFVWNVSGPFTQNARVRVRDSAMPNVNDVSTADFLIYTSVTDAPPPPPPTVMAFSSPRPNPARGATAFVVSLPEPQRVAVDVYDMQGRHVRSLVRGELGGGVHSIAWDGRDDDGVRTSAGVYYARMRAGSFESTRHVVRME